MWTRLMDLVVLVAEMSRSADQTHVELDKELSNRGYSADEIEHAVGWFSSRPEWRDAGRLPARSVRVLSEFERMSLSTAAYGYLFRLQNLGIIAGLQFETIVARAIPAAGEKVRLEDVKRIASSVIFDRDVSEIDDDDIFDYLDAGGTPV
ncbi:MAG TPA: DUF494 family protein [Candidatus Krumholzibacteria bacterium]|nr:DUF494 family protein [Candidatus Krumholzibacteria bacterium]